MSQWTADKQDQLRRALQDMAFYRDTLDAIASDCFCPHKKDAMGVGAAMPNNPCPVCLAWCAINPKLAQGRLKLAHDMLEQNQTMKDLGMDAAQSAPGLVLVDGGE